MMDEVLFSLEENWRVSSSQGVQYFDAPQQSAPVHHPTIDTKELLMASPNPLSFPLPFTTATPIPTHIDPSLLTTPASTTPSFSSSISTFEEASYEELLNQGYPGDSLTALERRQVLRRVIANEIAQLPTNCRDIKKLADVRRVTDIIPEDGLPSSGEKTPAFVLQCAWVDCNHYCSRPDRFKTHVFTHICFKPFSCDRSCGDPNWLSSF